MRKLQVVTLLTVLSFTQTCGAGLVFELGSEPEHRAFAADPRFQSVAGVAAPVNSNGSISYTTSGGVLIDPLWVLTVGHAVDFVAPGSELIVRFGPDMDSPDYTHSRTSSNWVIHPQWSLGQTPGTGIDLALIRLDAPILDIPIPDLYTGGDILGERWTSAGYGELYTADDGFIADDRTKRAGENIVSARGGSGIYSLHSPEYVFSEFDSLFTALMLEYGGTDGNSGDPLLFEQNGEQRLGALMAYNVGGFTTFSDTAAVDLRNQGPWISSVTSVPEPSSFYMVALVVFVAALRKAFLLFRRY